MRRIIVLSNSRIPVFFFFFACVFVLPNIALGQSNSSAKQLEQANITSKQWQKDLRFLQKTVHEKYIDVVSKKTTVEAFDAAVDEFHQEIPGLQEHEIVVGMARMFAMMEYGHTQLYLSTAPVKFHRLPIVMYEFRDGVFLQGVHKDYKDIIGAKVISIEGIPIEKTLQMVRPVVPAENEQFLKSNGYVYLCLPEVLHAQGITKTLKEEIALTLEKDGKAITKSIKAIERRPMPFSYGFLKTSGDWISARKEGKSPLYLKHLEKRYYYEFLPESKTVYVRHSSVLDDPNESIAEFYARVLKFVEDNEVEKLILDYRLNGGGNNYKNKPVITGLIESKKINQKGKLYAVIGRRTFSACQNLVNELDNYTNVTFVGEPTSENINFFGDANTIELPNSKMQGQISFAWWQDKPQWENGPWTEPDIAVEMSFEEYCANKDPVVETILSIAANDVVLDPLKHVSDLAGRGEINEAQIRSFMNDPRLSYWNFEDSINQTGYKFMGEGKLKKAMAIFEMNQRLNPESANAWDSLGECYYKSKQFTEAIKCYEKAIALDPNGPIGANSKSMLEQIKK